MACRVAVAHSASTLPELVLLVPWRLSRARCRAGAPAARSTLPDSARLIKTNKMTMTTIHCQKDKTQDLVQTVSCR